ncbi:MAG: inositol monophosphatase [Burkholderiales bacterium]|nr:inositol monophosphatase [Burkholderiales bacterium]
MSPAAEVEARYAAARRIARAAGGRALDYFHRRDELAVETKGVADYVTRADRDVEQFIRGELAAAFPGDGFLGEETAASFTGPLDRCWVVDPIDGTHNFLRGVPYWNVAIGYVEHGVTVVGAICDPNADEVHHARLGGGAWVDRRTGPSVRLHVAATTSLAGSYVTLGHHDRSFSDRYFEIRRRMMEANVAMRNFGSAALQLAHVASGRLDGFVEMEVSAWDAVAGLLLVTEAGGWHAPFAPVAPTAKAMCIAGAPGIAHELERLVRGA